jgi:hypothetical protein
MERFAQASARCRCGRLYRFGRVGDRLAGDGIRIRELARFDELPALGRRGRQRREFKIYPGR